MKAVRYWIFCFFFVLVLLGCSKKETEIVPEIIPEPVKADFHIALVTASENSNQDCARGVKEVINRYGSADDNGYIKHVSYPDDFLKKQSELVDLIFNLSQDPMTKAIIVTEAVPGTSVAFAKIKESRPDIFLIAGESHEDPLVIENTADLAVNCDYISRAYTIVWTAKQLGSLNFVHISYPRHLSYDSIAIRKKIMETACKNLGINFIELSITDPSLDSKNVSAANDIETKVPELIKQYGKNTAFFCTDDSLVAKLLPVLFVSGGNFIEADIPSPLLAYPEALGLNMFAEEGNYPAILQKTENAIMERKVDGYFGTWAYSYDFTLICGLTEFAKNVVDGKTTKDSMASLFDAFSIFTPDAKWNGGNYIDAETGIKSRNHILVYMDTYIFGKGYIPTTRESIPEEYYLITNKK